MKKLLVALGGAAVLFSGYFGYINYIAPPQIETCTWEIKCDTNKVFVYIEQDPGIVECTEPQVVFIVQDTITKHPECQWEVIFSEQDNYNIKPVLSEPTDLCPIPIVSCTGDGC